MQRNTSTLCGGCKQHPQEIGSVEVSLFCKRQLYVYFIYIYIYTYLYVELLIFELSCHWRLSGNSVLAKPALIQMSTQLTPRVPERPQLREQCRRWLLQGSLVMRWQRVASFQLWQLRAVGSMLHPLQGVDVAVSNVAPTTTPQKAELLAGWNLYEMPMWRYVSLWVQKFMSCLQSLQATGSPTLPPIDAGNSQAPKASAVVDSGRKLFIAHDEIMIGCATYNIHTRFVWWCLVYLYPVHVYNRCRYDADTEQSATSPDT